MSFIAAGIGAAGLALSAADKFGLFGGKGNAPTPYFDPGFDNRFGPNGVTGQERARQAVFQGQDDAITKHELGLYDNIQGQTDAKAKTLADYFTANSSHLPTSGPTAPGAMPVSHSAAVNADAAVKDARLAAFNDQQNGGLAKLRSFGDVWSDIGTGLAGDRTKLGTIANARAGDAALMPFEMQANYRAPSYGNQQPAPDGTFADILGGAGQLATSAAISGAFNGWGSPFQGTPAGLNTYGSPGYPASPRYGGPK